MHVLIYDLGLKVKAEDVPSGNIRFRMLGPTTENLVIAGQQLGQAETMMKIDLLCTQLRGDREVHHPLNRIWRLAIKSDVSTKFLTVDDMQSVPTRCPSCRRDLTDSSEVHSCRDCKNFALCHRCYKDPELNHPDGHIFNDFIW